MGIYKAIQFNTTTNLCDVTTIFDPTLIYANETYIAGEALQAGAVVTLIDAPLGSPPVNTVQVFNANATVMGSPPAAKRAMGFVLADVAQGNSAIVFFGGQLTVSGFGSPPVQYTPANVGQLVYLDTNPGKITLNPPSQPNLVQSVGAVIAVDGSGLATVSFFVSAIGAGEVTFVGLTLPGDTFSVSGSPITGAGTLGGSFISQAAGKFHAGPSVGSGLPTWRSIVTVDLSGAPASGSAIGAVQLANDLSGTAAAPTVVSTHLAAPLPVNQGGSGAATFTAHTVLLGNGTSAFAVTNVGTAGQILTSNGPGVDPSFQNAAADVDFYQTIQQAGSPKTQRPVLNFLAPVTATDNVGNTSTDINVPNFVGAVASPPAAGVRGLVPAPLVADLGKFLAADGTWSSPTATPSFNDTHQTVTYVTLLTDYYVRMDSTSPTNVTLTSAGSPPASPGKTYRIKNINTGLVTVLPASGLIDGQPSFTLTQFAAADFEWDGTNWNVF